MPRYADNLCKSYYAYVYVHLRLHLPFAWADLYVYNSNGCAYMPTCGRQDARGRRPVHCPLHSPTSGLRCREQRYSNYRNAVGRCYVGARQDCRSRRTVSTLAQALPESIWQIPRINAYMRNELGLRECTVSRPSTQQCFRLPMNCNVGLCLCVCMRCVVRAFVRAFVRVFA